MDFATRPMSSPHPPSSMRHSRPASVHPLHTDFPSLASTPTATSGVSPMHTIFPQQNGHYHLSPSDSSPHSRNAAINGYAPMVNGMDGAVSVKVEGSSLPQIPNASPHHSNTAPMMQSQSPQTNGHGSSFRTHKRETGIDVGASVVRDELRPVSPTWHGWISCTDDALKVIEACITHKLRRVQRRPDENERPSIIQSGAVFVFDESTTGILRWTDDRNWSPSRVRGNFMLYRELDGKVPAGEKKKALKKNKSPTTESNASHRSAGDKSRREDESSIRGSHTDSYKYKEDGGLMKRTFSAYYGETKWSVISYYDPLEVESDLLPRISDDPSLRMIEPRPELKGKSLQPSSQSTPLSSQMFHPPDAPIHAGGYDHLYHYYHQAPSSYAPSPMATSVSQGGYPVRMQDAGSSYQTSPVTPIFPSPGSYGSQSSPSRGQPYPNFPMQHSAKHDYDQTQTSVYQTPEVHHTPQAETRNYRDHLLGGRRASLQQHHMNTLPQVQSAPTSYADGLSSFAYNPPMQQALQMHPARSKQPSYQPDFYRQHMPQYAAPPN